MASRSPALLEVDVPLEVEMPTEVVVPPEIGVSSDNDVPREIDLKSALDRLGEMAGTLAVPVELTLNSGGHRERRAPIDRLVLSTGGSPGR